MIAPRISVVDLFCGAGGLSLGLRQAGLSIAAGIDNDPRCCYPYEANIEAPFLERDVCSITPDHLHNLWAPGSVRVLAGCAPCQPFSPYRRGVDTSREKQWPLLDEFSRLVRGTLPEMVTMENVPRVGGSAVFQRFVASLKEAYYHVAWRVHYGPQHGLAQTRRRLVLLASTLGPIELPSPTSGQQDVPTVRDVIGQLPALTAGSADSDDPLHMSRHLSEINLKRIRASKAGRTWEDWPTDLRAPCHQRSSGASFRNVYARMEWDQPAPTITTLASNFGAGRFGHPEQDRAITLREAALLQGFPPGYKFVAPNEKIQLSPVGRMIGNAVPPPIAMAAGLAIRDHARAHLPLHAGGSGDEQVQNDG